MPILPAEPDFYPPDLWDSPETAIGPGKWWCLHAKPRQEKALARELRAHQVKFYLPQVFQTGRTPKGRPTRSVVPLFPGYLFLHGTQEQRLTALRGNRLVQILEVSDQALLEHDLRQIQRVLAAGLNVEPEPTNPVGTRVKVVTGPLKGIEGVVVRRGKHDRFTAIVQFLKQGATVDLEDWQVEAIEANGTDILSA